MKLLILFALALSLHAQSLDLKRNQKVQRLSAKAIAAYAAYNAEMKAWSAECEAKGLQLAPVNANLMDCIQKPQQQQRPTPAKPEAK